MLNSVITSAHFMAAINQITADYLYSDSFGLVGIDFSFFFFFFAKGESS